MQVMLWTQSEVTLHKNGMTIHDIIDSENILLQAPSIIPSSLWEFTEG